MELDSGGAKIITVSQGETLPGPTTHHAHNYVVTFKEIFASEEVAALYELPFHCLLWPDSRPASRVVSCLGRVSSAALVGGFYVKTPTTSGLSIIDAKSSYMNVGGTQWDGDRPRRKLKHGH